MSSASQGSAPREGLQCLLVKMGRTGLLVEPRCGPQAGMSGDPRSQDADSSTRPKVCSDLASRRSQGASAERLGPQQPATSVDTWRLIGHGRPYFPT